MVLRNSFIILVFIGLLTNCRQEPTDISGHWHLYSADQKGVALNDDLAFTLDVIDNQYAFFNKEMLDSEERQIYLDFESDKQVPEVNIDTLEKNILPFSEVALSHFDYEWRPEGNLQLWTVDKNLDRTTYLAKRFQDCEKRDYCHFNPQVPNWCGMIQNWPKVALDPDFTLDPELFAFDIYLGYLETNRLAGIDKQIVLNFNKQQDFTFGNAREVLEGIKSLVPEEQRNKVAINLYIDDQMPYFVSDYLHNHLKKAGWLRIVYKSADGSSLLTRLPPFVENDCDPFFGRPCKRREIITKAELAELKKHNLGPDWAPVVRESQFRLKPENLFEVEVKADGELTLNGDSLSMENIPGLAKEFLMGSGNPATKIFRIITEGEANFGDYLQVLYLIRNVYDEVWEELAQELFSKEYARLEWNEIREVRNKVPLVISVWKK